MGTSLTRAAQWAASDSGGGQLESSPMNDTLLNEILRFVENFSSQNPQEAEVVFEEPLQWSTTLAPSDFTADYDIRESDVESQEKDDEGCPLLRLSPPTVCVRNFSQLSKLACVANEKKLQEVQACVEENRKPLVKILGPNIAALHKAAKADRGKEQQQSKDADVKVKLLRLLQHADKQILRKLMKEISEKVELNPTAVKKEVEFLKNICSTGENRLLKLVRYTSDYEFPNGCRAPLWRQLEGEMFYLVIEPYDTETLYITCSNTGVFFNMGIKPEGDEIAYERTGDVFKDLVSLLKSKSQVFAENIDSQEFREPPPPRAPKPHVELVDAQTQLSLKTSRWKDLRLSGEADEKKNGKDADEKNDGSKNKANFSEASFAEQLSSLKNKASRQAADLFSETSSESNESYEEEEQPVRRQRNTDQPSDYWQIQKLVKYLRAGDQTATLLTLYALMDYDLKQETYHLAMQDSGGLKVLTNILHLEEVNLQLGSLGILREISHNAQTRRAIVDNGGLRSIVNVLDSRNKDVKALAAETIANLTSFRRARRTVRNYNGISKLTKLLDCSADLANVDPRHEKDVEVARFGVLALWSCSKSPKNKEAIRKAGGIPLLGRLLKSPQMNMLIPVVGILQNCASEESCKAAIQTEGMIKDLVQNLSIDNDELRIHCANVIFQCAENKQTRTAVNEHRGLPALVSLLSKTDNKQLMAATTGAIWKCSLSSENLDVFQDSKVLETLIGLLTNQPEQVLVNVVGALAEFAQRPANKITIRKCGGLKPLVRLLIGRNEALLVNVTRVVEACATDLDNMAIIQELDGIRWVWSLLKNPSPDVQSSAAWALCPCIENAKEAGEMVSSLMGGMELVIDLLKSSDDKVLASMCAVVAKIAKDKYNLAVLTDYEVVSLLAKLTDKPNDLLRCHLAQAIAQCCTWRNNKAAFGEAGVVPPLAHYLKSQDMKVRHSTVLALHQLSKEPNNCVIMHGEGVVKPLIHFMGSDDEKIRNAAADCVRNIRVLFPGQARAKKSAPKSPNQH
ncbi:outer dynein arm-docking complex subunit 2 isoform X1 [Dunckerocampus dactyliophorus]|uniref:outer dynein arm-docking complex subunit 2 isoform X1 n=1 Tax=Dunckerocampus dactyliophorus TaxID=161453 RepID=UPI002404DFDE|nr:outer dynein arm-docking complex subunit 2 isoform X1 [Dunckerocampus dactyliophorus]XP_054621370.1 outer dynein arm-docking complex subunit 2 isoform X1 [Dunckerocampus dactyliophorus]XP_054621371.1 outer dynein arm-docking complex subunit 2 isoform X1 [Dunckerocampus dactyliophorus]XP_054621372.1 outer dynein arm-docking complex subunit 2 isoform X1 [Dunckerocampus dactyliophorus]XP_054621373.1 outer dynein arm-docking complex subunit 2 isoform X1 [Dunckerocampus dactyliophorus]XP_0546213